MIVVEANIENLFLLGQGVSEVVNPSCEHGDNHITLTGRISKRLITFVDTRSPAKFRIGSSPFKFLREGGWTCGLNLIQLLLEKNKLVPYRLAK